MNRPAFILDMDGVLVDSNPLHAHAWRVYLLQHGISADSILEQMHGKRNDQIVRTLFGRQLTDAEVFTHGAAKEQLYRKLMRPQLQSHLLPGLVPFLERHRQRLMGVASNAEPANIDFVLDEGKLRPFFPVAVAGNRVRNPKPDPEIYLLAASLLGVSPADCVVFEDSPTGIEAAKSAGARVVGVESTPAVLPDTDFRIRDFTDPGLDEWLAGLNGEDRR
jgi:beta-phosphoglucomutase